jgi:Protein of unknown function (DUF3617)
MIWKPFVAVLAVAIATPAFAAAVMHGGEWMTQNGGGRINHVCMTGDRVLDAATMSKMFTMEGLTCSPPKVGAAGNVTTYEAVCQVGGGRETIKDTMTATGPDSYVTHTQSHFEGPMKIPDSDDTQVSRRLGPCKPGDVKSPY